MKRLFNRFSYILLSCYMVFCPVASASIQVHAFEWVEPSLSFAESLGYLLSLLGIAYVGDKATNWEGWNDSGISSDYADEFQQYAIEHGLTYEETTSWMDEVGNGRLNQGSQVWEKFKAWASSLVGNNSSGNSVTSSIYSLTNYLIEYYGIQGVTNNLPSDVNCSAMLAYKAGRGVACFFFITDSTYTYTNPKVFSTVSPYQMYAFRIDNNSTLSSFGSVINRNSGFSFGDYSDVSAFNFTSDSNVDNFINISEPSLFVSISPESIEDFSLALQTAISDAIPDVIPLPWDNVGDNTQAINDKMDELLEKVAEGVLTIPAFMEAVQTLLGVFTVDTTADGVLIPEKPNPDTDEPQKLEDEANKNKSNSGFILGGLEKVFPFCIPFDLYAFMTLLVAEPVAPVIEYPIYNPVTDSNEEIVIDFSTWESVVVIFRYIFDFLFIIGLLLMARALIGEGSDA